MSLKITLFYEYLNSFALKRDIFTRQKKKICISQSVNDLCVLKSEGGLGTSSRAHAKRHQNQRALSVNETYQTVQREGTHHAVFIVYTVSKG